MLLFDAIDATLKPLVATLQQASRKERSPALYDQCVAAMEHAIEIGDDAALVLIAQTFGLVIDQHGYSDASIDWLLNATERARICGEPGEQSQLLHLVGRAYYSRAEYRIALDYWIEGMAVALQGNDLISWSWCKLGVGQVCDAVEAPELAVQIFSGLRQALSTLDGSARTLPMVQRPRFALRLRELKVVNSVNLAVNELKLGQLDAAAANFSQAQSMARAEAMDDIAWECQVRIAEVAALRSEFSEALELLNVCQKGLEDCSHYWGLATLHLLRSHCLSALGQLEAAGESIGRARVAANQANAKHISLRIEREAAQIAEGAGDLKEALASMKRAASLQTELDRSIKTQMLRDLQSLAELEVLPVA